MKFKVNNVATILLTTFVVFAAVGFASPIVATTLPGSNIATSKITVGDDTQVFAIADTNYLQGGHMQVPDLASMYAITSQRRSLGMLVTVIDTDSGTAGNQTVMYRLTSNPHGTDAPCSSGTSFVTDSSLDGKDYPAVCQTTAAANWTAIGSGSGTVTSFSAGNLSPLFTTSVSTATSTPSLSFTLSNQVANTFFTGPAIGSASAPTFRSMVFPDLPHMGSGNIIVGTGFGTSVSSVAVSGDATLDSSGALTIANNAVTYAKMQQVGALSLLGNPTGSTANAQEITLGSGLSFVSGALTSTPSVGALVAGGTPDEVFFADGSGNLAQTSDFVYSQGLASFAVGFGGTPNLKIDYGNLGYQLGYFQNPAWDGTAGSLSITSGTVTSYAYTTSGVIPLDTNSIVGIGGSFIFKDAAGSNMLTATDGAAYIGNTAYGTGGQFFVGQNDLAYSTTIGQYLKLRPGSNSYGFGDLSNTVFGTSYTIGGAEADVNGLGSSHVSGLSFAGSGLNDMALAAGTFTGPSGDSYRLVIQDVNTYALTDDPSTRTGSFSYGETVKWPGGETATFVGYASTGQFLIINPVGGIVTGTVIGLSSGATTKIVATDGTPRDTFSWRDGTVSQAYVLIDTSISIPLNNGVSVNFASATGHTAPDEWDWSYTTSFGRMLALNASTKTYSLGDVDSTGNSTRLVLSDATGNATITGGHALAASPVNFSGSGLDDFTIGSASFFSGVGGTTYNIQIDHTGVYVGLFSILSGPGFVAGDSITEVVGAGSGTTGTVITNDGTHLEFVLTSTSGLGVTFGSKWDNGSGTQIVLSPLGQFDTFTWNDGTSSEAAVPINLSADHLMSNGVYAHFTSTSGHVVGDTWTFGYSGGVGAMLNFDNASGTYKIGDIDSINHGNYLSIQDANNVAGLNSDTLEAAWDVHSKYSLNSGVSFNGGGFNDASFSNTLLPSSCPSVTVQVTTIELTVPSVAGFSVGDSVFDRITNAQGSITAISGSVITVNPIITVPVHLFGAGHVLHDTTANLDVTIYGTNDDILVNDVGYTGVYAMSYSPIPIGSCGVLASFSSTSGHISGDTWAIYNGASDILKLRSPFADTTVFSVGGTGAITGVDPYFNNTFLNLNPSTGLYQLGTFAGFSPSNFTLDAGHRIATLNTQTLQVNTDAGLGLNIDNATGTYQIGDITGGGGGFGAHFGLYNTNVGTWTASLDDVAGNNYFLINPSSHLFALGDHSSGGNQLLIGDDTGVSGATDAVVVRTNRIFGVEDTVGNNAVIYSDTMHDRYWLGDTVGTYGAGGSKPAYFFIDGPNQFSGINTQSPTAALDVVGLNTGTTTPYITVPTGGPSDMSLVSYSGATPGDTTHIRVVGVDVSYALISGSGSAFSVGDAVRQGGVTPSGSDILGVVTFKSVGLLKISYTFSSGTSGHAFSATTGASNRIYDTTVFGGATAKIVALNGDLMSVADAGGAISTPYDLTGATTTTIGNSTHQYDVNFTSNTGHTYGTQFLITYPSPVAQNIFSTHTASGLEVLNVKDDGTVTSYGSDGVARLSIDPGHNLYQIGAISTGGNTHLSIDDNAGSSNFYSSYFGVTSNFSGGLGLKLDMTAGDYFMGDSILNHTSLDISEATQSISMIANNVFDVSDNYTHSVLNLNATTDQYVMGDTGAYHGGTPAFLKIDGSTSHAGLNTLTPGSAFDVQNTNSTPSTITVDSYASGFGTSSTLPINVTGSYLGTASEITVTSDYVMLGFNRTFSYSGGSGFSVGDHVWDTSRGGRGTIVSITAVGVYDQVLVHYDHDLHTGVFTGSASCSVGSGSFTVTNGTVSGNASCGDSDYFTVSEDGGPSTAPVFMGYSGAFTALGTTGLSAQFTRNFWTNANSRWVIHIGANNITRMLDTTNKSERFTVADNGRTSIHSIYGGLTGLFDGATGLYGIGDLTGAGSSTSLYIDDNIKRILAKGSLDVQPVSSNISSPTIEYYGTVSPNPVTLGGTYATPTSQTVVAVKLNYRQFTVPTASFGGAYIGDHITATTGLHAAGVITNMVTSAYASSSLDVTVLMDANSPKDYFTGTMTDDTASFTFTPTFNFFGFTYTVNNGPSSTPQLITFGTPYSLGSTGLTVAFSNPAHANDTWIIRAGMMTNFQVGTTKTATQLSLTDAGTFSLYNLNGGRGAVFDPSSDYYGIGDVDSSLGGSGLIIDSAHKKISATVNANTVFSVDGTANTYSLGSNGFGNNTYFSIDDTAKTASVMMGNSSLGLTVTPTLDLAFMDHYSIGSPLQDNVRLKLDETSSTAWLFAPNFKVVAAGFITSPVFDVSQTGGSSNGWIKGYEGLFQLSSSTGGANYTYFDSVNGGAGGLYSIGDYNNDISGGHNTWITINDTSAHKISMKGDLYVLGSVSNCTLGTATGGVSCSSDARLKTNVQDLPSALDQLNKLRPVTFTWIDPTKPQGTNIGFIAQEVKEVFPQFVTQNDDYYGVDYAGLITPTIKAVQELNLKVDLATSLDPAREGSLATLISQFLENALNGIQSIFVNRVNTKELCLDDVCVTRDQLQKVLNQANVQAAIPATDATTNTTNNTTTTTDATSTTPTADTTTTSTATDTTSTPTNPVTPPAAPATDTTTTTPVDPTTPFSTSVSDAPIITPPVDAQSITVTQ